MKNYQILLLSLFLLVSSSLHAQIDVPLASPEGWVSSKVGLTNVKIKYYRPKVKGRKIFGSGSDYLVPFGEIWRTGANSGTKLKLDTQVKIGGQDVEAGKYLIFTIPNADQWNFILYSDLKIGGNVAAYSKDNEVLNIKVSANELKDKVETLTFNISDISEDNTSANIHLTWENTSVKIPIEVNFHDQVMKSIADQTQVNPSNYTAAANYYLESGQDLNQALTWIDTYLSIGENKNQFWHLHTKAKILGKLGNKKDAIKVAKESIELAKNFESGDFGYIKRNEDLIKSLK